ncbi:MAG: hypothetical protein V9G18_00035 [Albidovulum sp.]
MKRRIGDAGWAALQAAPMPGYSGPEPDELALMRIQKRVAEGRFDALSRDEQRWVCRRLLPSLVRFGRYPPPDEPPATPALPGDSDG